MRVDDPTTGLTHTISMLTTGDELANGTTSRFLHRDAFGFGAVTQRILFGVRESQRHRRCPTASN